MGLFTLLRFLTPNNGVSVSQADGDLSTTASLGFAVQNLDTYAARLNGTNTATSAFTADLSAASDTAGLKLPSKAGAVPTADGFLAFDTTKHELVYGSNGSTNVVPTPAPITNSLGSDVSLNSTVSFFDGPSVAQGTTGTWFASGNVTLTDTAGAAVFTVKLWDGTTVIASGIVQTSAANVLTTCSLSGELPSPAANIRLTVNDATSASGKIKFNASGTSKDSTITAIRVA